MISITWTSGSRILNLYQFWDAIKNWTVRYWNISIKRIWGSKKQYAHFSKQIWIEASIAGWPAGDHRRFGSLIIHLIFHLRSEDEIIIPEPLYATISAFLKAGNIRVRPIPTDFWKWIYVAFHWWIWESHQRKTKTILICNPNNPTGYATAMRNWTDWRK